jgi:hypothetical protein
VTDLIVARKVENDGLTAAGNLLVTVWDPDLGP